MEIARPLAALFTLYYLTVQTWIAVCQEGPPCDRVKAENCIKQLQEGYDEIKVTMDINKLKRLCVEVFQGNNITACLLESASACPLGDPWTIRDKWQRIHSGIRGRCNEVCPQYDERVRNVTRCTRLIDYDDVKRGEFNTFCRKLNISKSCVQRYQNDCQFSMWSHALNDLSSYVRRDAQICSRGCQGVDKVMAAARECAKKYDLTKSPSRYERYRRCSYFSNLMECLTRARTQDTCLEIHDLFDRVSSNFSAHTREYRQYCSNTASSYTASWLSALTISLVLVLSLSHR